MMDSLGVILPAAGRSIRFGSSRNKLLETVAGRAVIAWAVEAFVRRQDVAAIVIPCHETHALDAALAGLKDHRIRFCSGGATRAQSVRNGAEALGASVEWVAVHDAARPFVTQQLIDRTLAVARQHGAAVPALPIHLTVKQAMGPLPAAVQRTIPRNTLYAMQTPQIMRTAALLRAFANCPVPLEAVTDDVQLLELVGEPVWLVDGEEQNLKITTAMDLRVAEMIAGGHGV